MSVPYTGYLEFNWDEPNVIFTSYIVDVYVNQSFFHRKELPKSANYYSVSGLQEGSSAFLSITPSNKGSKYKKSKIVTNTQTIPIFQSTEKIGINSIKINGFVVPIERNIHDTHYVGSYSSQSRTNIYEIDMISPRDGNEFDLLEEPIFNKIVYKKHSKGPPAAIFDYNDDSVEGITQNLGYELENTTSGSTSSTNKIAITEKQESSYLVEFDIIDAYNQTNVALIDVNYSPIQISNVDISLFQYTGDNGLYSMKVYGDSRISYFKYQIYSDESHTQLVSEGQSTDPQSTSFYLDSSITGFLTVQPYGDHGSGLMYYDSPLVYPRVYPVPLANQLSNIKANIDYNLYYANFTANYIRNSEHDSLVYLDLYSNSSSSAELLMTGLFSGNSTALEYDLIEDYDGETELFYEINLLHADTLSREDSASGILKFRPPSLSPKLKFNYVSGETVYSPTNNFPNHSNLGIYFSGQGDSSFYQVFDNVTTDETNAYGKFELRHQNNNYLFDSVTLSGKAQNPSVFFSQNGLPKIKLLDYNFYLYTNNVTNGVKLYTKEASRLIEGTITPQALPSLSFDDYLNYSHETLSTGPVYREYNYNSVTNNVYEYEDQYNTGAYSSGNYRWFKAVPFNGYGDFEPSEYFTSLRVDRLHSLVLQEINEISTSVAEINSNTVYSYRAIIPSGADSISLSYSSLNFSHSPTLFHNVIAPNASSNIIISQTAGLPSSGSANIIFSDDIPNTGYYLDIFMQKEYNGFIT